MVDQVNNPASSALQQALGGLNNAQDNDAAIKQAVGSMNPTIKQQVEQSGLNLTQPEKLTTQQINDAFNQAVQRKKDETDRELNTNGDISRPPITPIGQSIANKAEREIKNLNEERQKLLDALANKSQAQKSSGVSPELSELRADIDRRETQLNDTLGRLNRDTDTCIYRGQSNLPDFFWLIFGKKKPDQRMLDILNKTLKEYQKQLQEYELRKKELDGFASNTSGSPDGGMLANHKATLPSGDTLFQPIAYTEDGLADENTPKDKIIGYAVPTQTVNGLEPGEETTQAAGEMVKEQANQNKSGVGFDRPAENKPFNLMVGNEQMLETAAKAQGITADSLAQQKPGFTLDVGHTPSIRAK